MSHTALYRCPGPLDIHGGKFDFKSVPDDQVDQALAEGWHLTTPEAKAAHEAQLAAEADANRPPTREEMLAKAEELHIRVDARWGDKRLGEEIARALKG